MISKKIIDLARSKAGQSTCTFRVSAIGLNRAGDVIGTACNMRGHNGKGMGLHAEINLLRKFGRKIRTAIICRVGGTGNLLPIHPCNTCSKVYSRLGIDILTVEAK